MSDSTARAGRADLTRQIIVISAVVFMIIAAMVGTGLLGGTAVQDLQDGALDSDGSFLAPARSAFSIWSVIYLGMIGYAVWQALPSQRTNPRQRVLGGWIALTAVLNGFWLVAAQFTTLPVTVLMIVVLLVTLGYTFHLVVRSTAATVWEVIFIDGTVGLHLGWVALATVANTSAWLTQLAPASWADNADATGAAVIGLVAVVGVAIAVLSRGRLAPAAAMAWGLFWIGVGRSSGEPQSETIAVAAWIAAIAIAAAAIIGTVLRLRRAARVSSSRSGVPR